MSLQHCAPELFIDKREDPHQARVTSEQHILGASHEGDVENARLIANLKPAAEVNMTLRSDVQVAVYDIWEQVALTAVFSMHAVP